MYKAKKDRTALDSSICNALGRSQDSAPILMSSILSSNQKKVFDSQNGFETKRKQALPHPAQLPPHGISCITIAKKPIHKKPADATRRHSAAVCEPIDPRFDTEHAMESSRQYIFIQVNKPKNSTERTQVISACRQTPPIEPVKISAVRAACADATAAFSSQPPRNGFSSNGAQSCQTAIFMRSDKMSFLLIFSEKFMPSLNVDRIEHRERLGATLDLRFWACQFHFGYPIGNRTAFEGQAYSRASACLTPDGKRRARTLADLRIDPAPPIAVTDWDACVDGVVRRLHIAIERIRAAHPGHQLICPLSGGWDSRAIAAVLSRQVGADGFLARTTNYDAGNDREERFAEQVAAALGLQHRILPLRPDYYQRCADLALLTTDFSTDLHIWMQDFVDQLDVAGPALILDGYGGDVLLRGLLQDVDDPGRAPDDPAFFQRFASMAASTVLPGPLLKTMEGLAREELARELASYPAANRTFWFALNNRGRRAVAGALDIQAARYPVGTPFMDPDLIAFVLSIAPGIRLSAQFYPAVLAALDGRLAGVASTNDKPDPGGWSRTDCRKHQPEVVDWMLENIRQVADNEHGLVDWFTLEAHRRLHAADGIDSVQRRRHLRALEMLHLHARWQNYYRPALEPAHLLSLELAGDGCQPGSIPPPVPAAPHVSAAHPDDALIRRWLERAATIAPARPLRVHWTMDVEAFPVSDRFSTHSAEADLINRMIYSDFGDGSGIDRLFHRQQVPCTYFLESYSPVWARDADFASAVRFFDTPISEVGLHCHAFSIPRPLLQGILVNPAPAWFLDERNLAPVFNWGRQRIGAAGGNAPLSFRSGRLDIYPGMTDALLRCGFQIDSSLVHQRHAFNYTDASLTIPNGCVRKGGIYEIPVTSYMRDKVIRQLDFNGSSLDECCFTVLRALELGLPAVTILLHSWSFSQTMQRLPLAKLLHHAADFALEEKFRRLLDFLRRCPGVIQSTLADTMRGTPLEDGDSTNQAPVEQFDPAAQVLVKVTRIGSQGRAEITLCGNRGNLEGNVTYAFYWFVDGIRVATRWYTGEAHADFDIPLGKQCHALGFVRDSQGRQLLSSKVPCPEMRDAGA